MKRQCILLVLLLLLTLVSSFGCSSTDPSSDLTAPLASEETENASITEDSAPAYDLGTEGLESRTIPEKRIAEQESKDIAENAENVTGIFYGLEDNHTAIFSFDGVESAFYFEADAVQNVLYGAIMESTYTFSYRFDEALQLNVIYEISE